MTPKGSKSMGNPHVSIVKSPTGNGQAMVVSYFILSQASGPGEAGGLLYYYDL